MYTLEMENPQYLMEAEEKLIRKIWAALKNYCLNHAEEISSAIVASTGNCYIPISRR